MTEGKSVGDRNAQEAREPGAHLKHGLRGHRAFSLEGTDGRVDDLDLIHEHKAS